jgi:hypothetical protein
MAQKKEALSRRATSLLGEATIARFPALKERCDPNAI